ncbi:MAG: FMN-binding protein [Pseudomonadota bacterium]
MSGPGNWQAAVRSGLQLGGLAGLAALLIGAVDHWTQAGRDANRLAAANARLEALWPGSSRAWDPGFQSVAGMPRVSVVTGTAPSPDAPHVYLNWPAPNGYAGRMQIAVAFRQVPDAPRPVVYAVAVLTHQETPGLGDRIERRRSPWLNQFTGLHAPAAARLRADGGEIDALSGATITARAVAEAVSHAMRIHHTRSARPPFTGKPSPQKRPPSEPEKRP